MSEDWRASFETSQTWQPDKPNKLQPVKQRHVGRWIVVLCTVVLLVPLVFGVFLLQNVAKISTNPWLIAPMPQDNGRTNILVLGSGDPGHAGENLTDTMIMLSTSRRKQHNGMVSLPRDLRVPIPGYGSGKINSAYALGGSALARQTVANITNQPVHSGLELRFSGLVTLVDQLDGLDVDVKERLYDPEYPCTSDQYKVCGLNIEAGQQHMSGQQVLAYVRCRKGTCGNDFGRAARQQEVISLVSQKMTKPSLIFKPKQLWNLSRSAAAILTTDLSLWQMGQLALQWQRYNQQAAASQLVLSTSNGGYLKNAGSSDLVPASGNWADIQEAIAGLVDRSSLN